MPMPNDWDGLGGRGGVLGVELESLSPQLGEYFGVKEGVLVRTVVKGSAADRAGMKAGDVILKVGDNRVSTPGQVSMWIRSSRAKSPVAVAIMRDRRELTLSVNLSDGRSGDSPTRKEQAVRSRSVKVE
jgi:serine protease Do